MFVTFASYECDRGHLIRVWYCEYRFYVIWLCLTVLHNPGLCTPYLSAASDTQIGIVSGFMTLQNSQHCRRGVWNSKVGDTRGTSIHGQVGAGDVGREVRGQETGHAGDLLGSTNTL
jgi:hypothetical protein